MANWLRTLDITQEWKAVNDPKVAGNIRQQYANFAKSIHAKLTKLKKLEAKEAPGVPNELIQYTYNEQIEIADLFNSLTDEVFDIESPFYDVDEAEAELNYLLQRLYDWGDINLGGSDRMCWIKRI